MGWSIGFDSRWNRDIGYGVPATCDYPSCGEAIDRGLGYVCGAEPYGGENGCGLFFCGEHMFCSDESRQACERCRDGKPPFAATPDTREWIKWKLADESWAAWRDENPEAVRTMQAAVSDAAVLSPEPCYRGHLGDRDNYPGRPHWRHFRRSAAT